MEDKYFLTSFENVSGETIPAPVIRHSNECKQYNIKKKGGRGKGKEKEKETEEKKKQKGEDKNKDKEKEEYKDKKEEIYGLEEVEGEKEENEDEKDKYLCINFNKFNGLCYDKIIPCLDDTQLNFSIGESLMYVANFYLEKKIISKQFYNRIFHSFQLALFQVLSEVGEDNKNKWNMRGKILNMKKENNINIIYVENASLSIRTIKMYVPLLKIKAIDL